MNLADQLNLGCACQTLETRRLREQLEGDFGGQAGLVDRLAQSHPHLFSATPVFLDPGVHEQIVAAVKAIETVVALPAWQAQALARAPEIAACHWGPSGVFMGYDFHLSAEGPRLIEINSNAGGAWLNAALARAHRACCASMAPVLDPQNDLADLEADFVEMFRNEWRSQRGQHGNRPWRNVLIVDQAPQQQYLAPEFDIARQRFAQHGLIAVIADPSELQWRDGALWHPALPPDMPVDMVYNRLTDFYLQDRGHEALAQAFQTGAAVVTPHPGTHALFADKRNLMALSDDALLAQWGVSDADRALLGRVVPETQPVTVDQAQALWSRRRELFFKPAGGFGSRAAYRGDKLTRRVWDDILQADAYVAQALVAPSERLVRVGDETRRLKLDLRAYSYQGTVQLMAARTWTGQTTNFRTDGGGFSPVIVLPPSSAASPDPGHC